MQGVGHGVSGVGWEYSFLITRPVALVELSPVQVLPWQWFLSRTPMRGPVPGSDPSWDAACGPYIRDIRLRKFKADPLIHQELGRLESLWLSETGFKPS
jgi:hypothetical protein